MKRSRHRQYRVVEAACATCGKAFRGRIGQRFCSTRCSDYAKRYRRDATCQTCGQPFRGTTGQRFCSSRCGARYSRPEVKARISAARRRRGRPHAEFLQALAPEAFGTLPPLVQRVVRLYYGLVDGRPWTHREIHEAEHIAQVRVPQLIAAGVAQLLAFYPSAPPRPPAA